MNTLCRGNIWTIAGTELGSDECSTILVARALYGLKRSGESWGSILDGTLGKYVSLYTASKAYKGVWIKKEVFPNVMSQYLIILVYVDDIMFLLKDNSTDIDYLANTAKTK